jgi:Protein of unknown function (DUF3106)
MKRSTTSLVCLGFAIAWLGLPDFSALAQTNPVIAPVPLPMLRSPVDSFRALLTMPMTERRQFLATRGTNAQEQLKQKIVEYQKLPPEECELRLKATELRWYLQPLMRSSPTNRASQLALIPENMRGLVAVRLEQWDQISAPVQQMFLTKELSAGYFSRVAGPTNFPPLPTTQIRQQLQLTARINQLFDLTAEEKENVLATLSDVEREQMEKTLAAYEKLAPGQRKQCLMSFKKFVGMSLTERQQFLQNAERWAQMSPAERQSWREVVSVAPNLPPLPIRLVPQPPQPGDPRKPGVPAVTNGG